MSGDLAAAIRDATRALQNLNEAMKPRTEAGYWQWLRYNNPLMYIAQQRAQRRGRSVRRVAGSGEPE